jgi:hypothetical protein
MAATRNDIKALAKERHPTATTIQLRRLSDFRVIGVVGNDAGQPDWLLIIGGGKDAIRYKADTLDALLATLSAD